MITNAIVLAAALNFHAPQLWWNALAQVETGGNDMAVGVAGERGRYQCCEIYWREATALPFTSATNPVIAQAVAAEIICKRTRGRVLTAKQFVRAWHGWRNDAAHRDYLRRFLNLINQ